MTAIRAVLLDFHSTLVDQGDATEWLAAGMARRDGGAASVGLTRSGVHLDPADREAVIARLDDIWVHARVIDPGSGRDHSAEAHASVFHDVMRGHVDDGLLQALYDVMLDMWWAYDDAAPLLDALRERGVRTAVLSNIGVDIRPVMQRYGLRADAVILSCEVGAVKPQPEIFRAALESLDARPEETLMVGDAWKDDGGAAALGIRTLILPRTRGRIHGLDAVLRLVD